MEDEEKGMFRHHNKLTKPLCAELLCHYAKSVRQLLTPLHMCTYAYIEDKEMHTYQYLTTSTVQSASKFNLMSTHM